LKFHLKFCFYVIIWPRGSWFYQGHLPTVAYKQSLFYSVLTDLQLPVTISSFLSLGVELAPLLCHVWFLIWYVGILVMSCGDTW